MDFLDSINITFSKEPSFQKTSSKVIWHLIYYLSYAPFQESKGSRKLYIEREKCFEVRSNERLVEGAKRGINLKKNYMAI